LKCRKVLIVHLKLVHELDIISIRTQLRLTIRLEVLLEEAEVQEQITTTIIIIIIIWRTHHLELMILSLILTSE